MRLVLRISELCHKVCLAVVHFGRADKYSTVPRVKQSVALGNQTLCVCVYAHLAHKLWKSGRGGSSLTEQALFIPQCNALGVRGG